MDIVTTSDQPISSTEGETSDVDRKFPLNCMGLIEACRSCLASLEALLPTDFGATDGSTVPRRRRITLTELAWPLKRSKAMKLLAEISQHKSTLLFAMSGDVM
jgi:hypothetical protein